tara:strand:+ start:459 stop:938 length:480 start_codon:yes stop_codon:yes gene_type:complete
MNDNSRAYPDRPYVGVGVVVFRDDSVLLAQRGKRPRLNRWSIPGGAQEIGETIEQAAHREIFEETGVRIELLGLIDVVNSINRDEDQRVQFHYTLVDFVAQWKSGEIIAGDDAADARWVHIAKLESYNLRPLTQEVIRSADKIRNSGRVSKQKRLGGVL